MPTTAFSYSILQFYGVAKKQHTHQSKKKRRMTTKQHITDTAYVNDEMFILTLSKVLGTM